MRAFSGASAAVAAALIVSVAGCAKIGELKGMKAFKSGNTAYQQQDYKAAATFYEEAVQADPDLQHGQPYFFLGNSYDNQYKPSRKGEADNDALLDKAVQNYQTASEKLSASPNEDDKKLGKLALQYLVAAYGADKMNDPAKAEPVVQKMIQLEPTEPTNYFALANIYEQAGVYDEAEKMYLAAKEAKPTDPTVYMQLAGFYNRQGEFDKTIDALEQRAQREPNNPEAFHTIASFYWDETTRDARLSPQEKKGYVQKGLEAVDKALALKPDYVEALTFKGLLLRLQANLETDAGKQQSLLKEADQLRDRANDLRKQKTAGATQ
jgi:tetratricopeptide (TPR) repeat protein